MTVESVDDAARRYACERAVQAGFGDLISHGIVVNTCTIEEAEFFTGNSNWLGQYFCGSISSGSGISIIINIDRHDSPEELSRTVLHEIGHGLWELLPLETQQRWSASLRHVLEPEEAFADDFAFFCLGLENKMTDLYLFEAVVRFRRKL